MHTSGRLTVVIRPLGPPSNRRSRAVGLVMGQSGYPSTKALLSTRKEGSGVGTNPHARKSNARKADLPGLKGRGVDRAMGNEIV